MNDKLRSSSKKDLLLGFPHTHDLPEDVIIHLLHQQPIPACFANASTSGLSPFLHSLLNLGMRPSPAVPLVMLGALDAVVPVVMSTLYLRNA
ncbi:MULTISPECIES: hypothetical protein [unclassified Paenibacillus]|uniref:hypothetical protein n=1 Tax=unclassified Paenibacillus TaxID=185978 RepID=UPI001180B2DA